MPLQIEVDELDFDASIFKRSGDAPCAEGVPRITGGVIGGLEDATLAMHVSAASCQK